MDTTAPGTDPLSCYRCGGHVPGAVRCARYCSAACEEADRIICGLREENRILRLQLDAAARREAA